MVFRVRSQWKAEEVSSNALSVNAWSVAEIEDAWDFWLEIVPQEKAALFDCGASMFLCDIGHPDTAVKWLAEVYGRNASAIIKKWRYLKETRSDFRTRYAPLFEYLTSQGAL
jgi:hypothetical protein